MAKKDEEFRKAFWTGSSSFSEVLSDPLLEKSPSQMSGSSLTNLKKSSNFFDFSEESLEHIICRLFMTADDWHKKQTRKMTAKELVKLYSDPKYETEPGYQMLKKYHAVAPPKMKYDSSSPIKTLLHFGGTGLELILQRPDFWILFIFHLAISLTYFGLGYKAVNGVPTAKGWPQVGTNAVAIPGALITFVLVFYLNQTFTRYLTQNTHVVGTAGVLGEFILMLRVHFGDQAFPRARIVRHQICKFLNALHFLAYAMLPQNRLEKIDEWAWWYLQETRLLTKKQVEELRDLQPLGTGNLVYKELLVWVEKGVWAQHSKGHIDLEVGNLFSQKVSEIRSHLDALYTFQSGTVPFAYFHLLNFAILLYLFMLSYAFVFVTPYWSIPSFFLILFSILGIREIGNKMSDPLGNDNIDLPVFDVAQGFLSESILIINKDSTYADELMDLVPKDDSQGGEISQENGKSYSTGD